MASDPPPPATPPHAALPSAPEYPYAYPSYPPYLTYPPDTGYAPAPYVYPPYPWMYAPPASRLGTWALTSMICGIVSVFSVQIILAILAIIFGFIGLNEVKKSAGMIEGRGFAITGIVTGFISVGITLLIVLFYVFEFIVLLSMYQTIPG